MEKPLNTHIQSENRLSLSCKKALIIGYVWPEPQSSAAGLRDWNLVETLIQGGWDVVFASSSQLNAHSEKLQNAGIRLVEVQPNDPSFDLWIQQEQFDLVIFDRFIIEEQFGWRIQEHSPHTIRILDTIDLHLLRRTRERLMKEGKSISEIKNCQSYLNNEDSHREIAAVYRCDGVLVVSDFEREMLIQQFSVPATMIFLSRLSYPPVRPASLPTYEDRNHFVMIGNFRHAPNRDAVLWFSRELWPAIRKRLPEAELHIYGAYPPKDMIQLTSKKDGLIVQGYTPDQYKTLQDYRVNLAPLRFGAGIKGKISDGWWCGTPVVSTSIGSEGMHEDLPFGGAVSDDLSEFVELSISLYSKSELWKKSQDHGLQIMSRFYSAQENSIDLLNYLERVRANLNSIRNSNWLGSLLSYHSYRSTRYFSRWIEEKSKRLGNDVCLNRS